MTARTYRHLAAMGSSFASGPGIQPMAEKSAMRSSRNYAHVLAERLGADLTDLTIGGATTATILETPQRLMGRQFPPQIDGLPNDADLVTITAGGNDLTYASSLLKAGWAGWFEQHALTRPLGRRLNADVVPRAGEADVERAASGLSRVVAETRRRAPGARILLVDYLTIIGERTERSAQLPFRQDIIEGFRRVGAALESAFELAAESSSAELVKVSSLSRDHAVGPADPWVEGFRPTFRGVTAFHPNGAGMSAVADAVEKHLSDHPSD